MSKVHCIDKYLGLEWYWLNGKLRGRTSYRERNEYYREESITLQEVLGLYKNARQRSQS